MESRRRKAILWILCAGLALGLMVPLRASGTGPNFAVIKRIGSRVDDRAGVISIEASDPVPYVASQPDPNTFVVEMRDAVIRDLRVARRGTATALTLQGTARLITTNVEESKDPPARLYIDVANATSALPGLTPIGQGVVQNVRIG